MYLILPAVALALALVGFDRVAGALAMAWTAARFPALLDHWAARREGRRRPGDVLATPADD